MPAAQPSAAACPDPLVRRWSPLIASRGCPKETHPPPKTSPNPRSRLSPGFSAGHANARENGWTHAPGPGRVCMTPLTWVDSAPQAHCDCHPTKLHSRIQKLSPGEDPFGGNPRTRDSSIELPERVRDSCPTRAVGSLPRPTWCSPSRPSPLRPPPMWPAMLSGPLPRGAGEGNGLAVAFRFASLEVHVDPTLTR